MEGVYARAARLPNLRLRGVQMHIGSQLTEVQPFELAVKKVLPLVRQLAGASSAWNFSASAAGWASSINPALASGSAAWWKSAAARGILTPARYAERLVPLLKPLGLKILIEPGRFIVGNAGILVTRVQYVKQPGRKNFVIVDAAMNDLIRPAMYDSYHEIVPRRATERQADFVRRGGADLRIGRLFLQGPSACRKVGEGDCLALLSAGAYGFVMASNYNARAHAAEVLVNGKKAAVVRRRQDVEELWARPEESG